MNPAQIKETIDLLFKDVFGRPCPFSIDELEARLTVGIPLPARVTCVLTGQETFVYDPQPDQMFVSQEGFMGQARIDDWMKPKRPLESMKDVFDAWKQVSYMTGEKHINSQNVTQSDSILTSSNIYRSSLIGSSKGILLSHHNYFSNYLLACRGNTSCNFGIRVFDSGYCASNYEVRWSNKVSRSYFINDCLDLYECLFCYGIRSKKYCIANMQYEQAEYMKIKEMVIDWILNEQMRST